MDQFGYIWVEVNTSGGAAKDAWVYVDGTLRVDHVPAKMLLSPGAHSVEVRKAGVKFAQNPRHVKVAAGSPAKPLPLVFAAAE
jgi:hypothetical protein